MKLIAPLACILAALTLFQLANAQDAEVETEKKSLDSGTIKSQFEYVFEESNRYQEYKVVKMEWLDILKSHVLDSLKAVHKELDETRKVVAKQESDIAALKADSKNVRDTLATTNNEKNSIDFLNVSMKKSSYKSIMWTITAALTALLAFFIFKFRRSDVITTETKKLLSEVQTEFEAFKKRSREREQVLKRELQDELNKRL